MRLLLSILMSTCFLSMNAQDSRVYKTRDGKLGISIYYVDTLLAIGSNDLRLLIDNETRDILIAVNPNTLKTKVDSLDDMLTSGFYNDIVFKGQIGLNQVQTKGRSLQKFDVTGNLTINRHTKHIVMQGTLQHFEEGPGVESLLYLHYDINLVDFGLDKTLPGFANDGCVEILQGLLLPTSH